MASNIVSNPSLGGLVTVATSPTDDAGSGDLLQLQVASTSNNFSSVTNIGTVFQANHVSELLVL